MDYNEYVFIYEVNNFQKQLRKIRYVNGIEEQEFDNKKGIKRLLHRLFHSENKCYYA